MIFSIVFAAHHLGPANSFPAFCLWQLTRPAQVKLRCGFPLFRPTSRLSSVCHSIGPANSHPVRGSLSLTHLESILAKVYQNKQLKPPLELYTYEKHGVACSSFELGLPQITFYPTRPIAAGAPWCNNGVQCHQYFTPHGNN